MPVVVKLNTGHFNNVIRAVKRSQTDRVESIRTASFRTLRRLRVKRDLSKAVAKLPKGSDQVNVGSIVTWMDKIQPENKAAIRQLVAIDATAVVRMK